MILDHPERLQEERNPQAVGGWTTLRRRFAEAFPWIGGTFVTIAFLVVMLGLMAIGGGS